MNGESNVSFNLVRIGMNVATLSAKHRDVLENTLDDCWPFIVGVSDINLASGQLTWLHTCCYKALLLHNLSLSDQKLFSFIAYKAVDKFGGLVVDATLAGIPMSKVCERNRNLLMIIYFAYAAIGCFGDIVI